jgi:hypothetical protein
MRSRAGLTDVLYQRVRKIIAFGGLSGAGSGFIVRGAGGRYRRSLFIDAVACLAAVIQLGERITFVPSESDIRLHNRREPLKQTTVLLL